MSQAPWTFGEARDASDEAARAQEAAEDRVRDTGRTHAKAEEAYRIARAGEMIRLKSTGVPATVTGDLARGDEHVAMLRRELREAETDYEVAKQAGWRRSADRKDVAAFTDWSKRRDLAEGGAVREPDERTMPRFGSGRRAA